MSVRHPSFRCCWRWCCRRCCPASSTAPRRCSPDGAARPLLQTYFDLWKLLRKGAVYSRTTTLDFPRRADAGIGGGAGSGNAGAAGEFSGAHRVPGGFPSLRRTARVDAVFHGPGGAGHRFEFRRHGRKPRSLFLRAGRAGVARGAGHAGAAGRKSFTFGHARPGVRRSLAARRAGAGAGGHRVDDCAACRKRAHPRGRSRTPTSN